GALRGGGTGPGPGGPAIAAHARRQPAGARHLPRADRDQYHRLAGEHAARRPRHGATAPRRRVPGGRCARAARPRCEARQPRGPLPRHRRGRGGRPIIVFAHLDVVPARRADWSVDPFTLLEKDGYFYGRGTTDNKAGAAMLVADFIRLKQAGFKPRRDLILMLNGDEETAGSCI